MIAYIRYTDIHGTAVLVHPTTKESIPADSRNTDYTLHQTQEDLGLASTTDVESVIA